VAQALACEVFEPRRPWRRVQIYIKKSNSSKRKKWKRSKLLILVT